MTWAVKKSRITLLATLEASDKLEIKFNLSLNNFRDTQGFGAGL